MQIMFGGKKARVMILMISMLSFFLIQESSAIDCPKDNSQDRIYPGCNCFFEWNDANRVGNWTFEENWMQLNEPGWVAFVSIAGDNTIHLDEPRRINEIYIGPNRWDTTRVILDQDLTVEYDDVPVITVVNGYRQPTGQVRLVIQGKGFGFVSEDIVVTATQVLDNSPDNNVDNQITQVYNCEYATLVYRDVQIECNILTADLYPFSLSVTVAANGYVSAPVLISTYLQ